MLIPLRSIFQSGVVPPGPGATTPGAYMAHPGILAMPQFLIERRKQRQMEEEFVALMFDEF